MNHVLWTAGPVENACHLSAMKGFRERYKITQGQPVATVIPPDVSFEMDPDFPDDTLTTDCMLNQGQMVIISERVRDFLQPITGASVEYLPVTVLDLKGKKTKTNHFVVNPTTIVPALKLDQCKATLDKLEMIQEMGALVVDQELLDKAPPVFRVKHFPRYIWVRRELAKELDAHGFEGNRWIRPEAVADGEMLPTLEDMHTSANATL